MTTYTITESQMQQLLEAVDFHSDTVEMLQSLTPNSGDVVAYGVFHKDGSAHIFQQQSTAQVFGEVQALYLHPAPSTKPAKKMVTPYITQEHFDRAFPDTTAPPKPIIEYVWECNECGSQEYTMCVSESDVQELGCGGCGSSEWHKAPIRGQA